MSYDRLLLRKLIGIALRFPIVATLGLLWEYGQVCSWLLPIFFKSQEQT